MQLFCLQISTFVLCCMLLKIGFFKAYNLPNWHIRCLGIHKINDEYIT